MAAKLVPLGVGSPIIIDKAIVLIGRHPDCDSILQTSVKVSRRHCCVALVNDHYKIRDLGSMNGVRVNGNRVREGDLHPEDEVSIGDVRYVFKCDAAAAAADKASGNGRENGKSVEARPAAVADPVPALPPAPLELSMEYPVAIPDEHPEAAGVADVQVEDSGPNLIPQIPIEDISLKDLA